VSFTNVTPRNAVDVAANARSSTSPFVDIFMGRDPTPYDVNYSTQQKWLNTATGAYWILEGFSSSQGIVSAIWLEIGASGGETIRFVEVDLATSPGVNPVSATEGGIITVTGNQIAAGSTPNVIRTDTTALHQWTIEVQRSQAAATSTIADNGVAHFSSFDFAVDANAFVEIQPLSTFFTPTVSGSTIPGTTTYTVQSGTYYRIGSLVYSQFTIAWSATTGTGDVVLDGWPYNFGGASPRAPVATVWVENMTWPSGVTYFVGLGQDNTTTMVIEGLQSGMISQHLQMQATGTINASLVYFTSDPP
jgi:hypothetical protein